MRTARITTAAAVSIAVSLAASACFQPGTAYDCTVTVLSPSGAPTASQDVSVKADSLQEAIRQANAQVGGDLRSQFQGSQIEISCQPKADRPKIEVTPVSYTYPSDSLKGLTLAYEHPIGGMTARGAVRAMLARQGASTSASFLDRSALSTSFVVRIDLTKADGGFAPVYLGGVRVSHQVNPRLDVYGEVLGGVTHFPGENDFTFVPAVGVVVPIEGHHFAVTGSIGFPHISFSGDGELGWRFAGGISIPFGR